MNITPVYAALLGLVFVVLSVRTLRLRQRLQIGIGDAGDRSMLRAMRVHANFAEYVPLTLLLIYMLEVTTRSGILIHVLCTSLLLGRIVHAYGVSQVAENLRFRVVGMLLTFVALIGAALRVLLAALVGATP